MTIDDYLGVRMISYAVLPLRLRRPVRRRDRGDRVARPTRRPTCATRRCRSRRSARALHGRPSWDQFDDLTTMAGRDAGRAAVGAHRPQARRRRRRRALRRVQLHHDAWLEALGFCGKGESGPFIEGGERIARDGELPLNTHGGQLSAGRLHGYGFLHEACVQLWGEAGDRQVGRYPEVAVAAAGGGPIAGCLLLSAGG